MDSQLGSGIFSISLDFELHWGVSEHRSVQSYKENLDNVPQAVVEILKLFKEYDIHATWAIVGMLSSPSKSKIYKYIDQDSLPIYKNRKLSNYLVLERLNEDLKDDPYHYAQPLIDLVAASSGQELATHTFSHYYCLEEGQEISDFEKDIEAAIHISKDNGIVVQSIVFPRNQYNDLHLEAIQEKGILNFRGNEPHWMYAPRSRANETSLRKFARLIDSYLKISGDNTHNVVKGDLVNIPSSRFLRPYDPRMDILEPLRIRRIEREMTYAAKMNRLYHLWWHPHNFGKYLEKNLKVLERILKHAEKLSIEFGFKSMNMCEVGNMIRGEA